MADVAAPPIVAAGGTGAGCTPGGNGAGFVTAEGWVTTAVLEDGAFCEAGTPGVTSLRTAGAGVAGESAV